MPTREWWHRCRASGCHNLILPPARKTGHKRKGHVQRWCSRRCNARARYKPRPKVDRERVVVPSYPGVNPVPWVTQFLVGCRSIEEIAREHGTTPELVAAVLKRMGISDPEQCREFELPSALVRDLSQVT